MSDWDEDKDDYDHSRAREHWERAKTVIRKRRTLGNVLEAITQQRLVDPIPDVTVTLASDRKMEARHWWIASKIQDTFSIGGTSNPSGLEEYICEPETLDLINELFIAGGQRRLFFYVEREKGTSHDIVLQLTQLRYTNNLLECKEVKTYDTPILYFIRPDVTKDVDATRFERDILTGVVVGDPALCFAETMQYVFLPQLRQQKDWGRCPPEIATQTIHNLEKYTQQMYDTIAMSGNTHLSTNQQMLKFTERVKNLDFKQLRDAHLDADLVAELETLIQEWSSTLETILMEGAEDRSRDLKIDPSTEMDKWRRRQRLLGGTIEQLKQKEVKNVLAVLNNSKSKSIKRWRQLDNQITECFNDARDKSKYLEALNRFFVQMSSATTSPLEMVETVVPQLFQHVKNLESLSKHYAKTGFLGLVIFQISNLLVSKMLDFISEVCYLDQGTTDNYVRQCLKEARDGLVMKTEASSDPPSVFSRLLFCNALCDKFKEQVRKLRVSLNVGVQNTTLTQESSLSMASSSNPVTAGAGQRNSAVRGAAQGEATAGKELSDQSGIAITDDTQLMFHIDLFLDRTFKVVDILTTLAEYEKLLISAPGVPRPRIEDIMDTTDENEIRMRAEIERGRRAKHEWKQRTSAQHAAELRSSQLDVISYDSDNDSEKHLIDDHQSPTQSESGNVAETITNGDAHTNLTGNLVEESKESFSSFGRSDASAQKLFTQRQSQLEISAAPFGADEAYEIEESPRKNAIEARRTLRKIYSDWGLNLTADGSIGPPGPSFDELLTRRYDELKVIFSSVEKVKQVLDFKGNDREKFETLYKKFLSKIGEIEIIVSSYILALFMRTMTTQEALKQLEKFEPIRRRPGVSVALTEAYEIVFGFYEKDMKEIHTAYEKGKDAPPITRNAPPVGGAIQWVRQLIGRIEIPMINFRANEAMCKMREFSKICKQYNKLAEVLITYETLWYTQWKQTLDSTSGGGGSGLQLNVLSYNPRESLIVVNSDKGVYEMLQEAKFMSRMQMDLPDVAKRILNNEMRFKKYKSRLDSLISDFYEVKDMIPAEMTSLFKPHIHTMISIFSPGWMTISWNSMNIDAYLFKVHSAIHRFRKLTRKVLKLVDSRIEKALTSIEDMVLFDHHLAFSQSWSPEMFSRKMLTSVQEQYKKLFEQISEIKNTILEIVQVLLSSRVDSDNSKKPGNAIKEDKFKLNLREISRGVGRDLPSDDEDDEGVETGSEAGSERTIELSVDSDNGVKDLFSHFSPRIYHSLSRAVVESLLVLSIGCGTSHALRQPPLTPSRPASVPRSGRSSRHWPPNPSPAPSSKGSQVGRNEATMTPLSTLMSSTWDVSEIDTHLIRFDVDLTFSIPTYTVIPSLLVVQECIKELASSVLETGKTVKRWDDFDGTYFDDLTREAEVQDVLSDINDVIVEIQSTLDRHLRHFSLYDFLWKDDMKGNFEEFMESEPHTTRLQSEVQRMCDIQKAVTDIPMKIQIGPICLNSTPVKNTLLGFTTAWKSQYADVLHNDARVELAKAVEYQMEAVTQISDDVNGLGQLNDALSKLREVYDMVNRIDSIYLPIENKYAMLRSFGVHLPRDEVHNVESLRSNWQHLVEKADKVQDKLMREERNIFEQELDKQIMDFVLEVAKLRNNFEAQGPGVPGIDPLEAVKRLEHFDKVYQEFDEKRRTLDSIQRIFSYDAEKFKNFPDLDRTGEELQLMDSLYELYQKFLHFDTTFKDTLWSDVTLDTFELQVNSFTKSFAQLPSGLVDYDSFHNLKGAIEEYVKVFPLLKKLNRREIRNRHWLQVMQVTGKSFLLEANVFKLKALLEIGLYVKKDDIEEICANAGLELELEMKLRMTEEEWGEQVLIVEHYKRRGKVFLNKNSSKKVLEQLEDAQALLAGMLTSKHIGPMREEAAMWAEKLKHVAEVLELWLEVQDLWMYLENVFSNPKAAKDLPQEVKRFGKVDKSWMKMMQKASETKNVIQCCTSASDVPRQVVLRHTKEELEICFKSLTGYLDGKRRVFPRFCFVSDNMLFAIISQPHTLEAVRPYLRNLFVALSDLQLVGTGRSLDEQIQLEHGESQRKLQASMQNADGASTPVSTFSVSGVDLSSVHGGGTVAGGEGVEPQEVMAAVAAFSFDGEVIPLANAVELTEGTDVWLGKLEHEVGSGLHTGIEAASQIALQSNSFEEIAVNFPTQVGLVALMNYFTVESEAAVSDVRHERRGIPHVRHKFQTAIQKLISLCLRGVWKSSNEQHGCKLSVSGGEEQPAEIITKRQRTRFEAMIMLSVYHRELLDHLATRKGLKELYDFEWRKNIRAYIYKDTPNSPPQVVIKLLNMEFTYGTEFYGSIPPLVIRPQTERVIVCTAQAIKGSEGVIYSGQTGSGKMKTALGMSQLLARNLTVIDCNESTQPEVILRSMQGVAAAGHWMLVRNVDTLSGSPLSVFLQNYIVLQHTVKMIVSQNPALLMSRQALDSLDGGSYSSSEGDLGSEDGGSSVVRTSVFLSNGSKVHVSPSMFIMCTSTKFLIELPPELGERFRNVAISMPDIGIIIRTTASSLGFRHPKLLADRIKIICELLDDYLTGETIGSVSVSMIQQALSLAKEKFTKLKDMYPDFARQGYSTTQLQQIEELEQTFEVNNQVINVKLSTKAAVAKQAREREAAIESQKALQKLLGKKSVVQTLPNNSKLEHAVVGDVLLEIFSLKLKQENVHILELIVRDIFGGLPEVPQLTLAPAALKGELESVCDSNNLHLYGPWIEKCVHLYTASLTNHGMILCGPTGSGKSRSLSTLVDALAKLETPSSVSMVSEHAQSEHSGNTTMGAVSHRLVRINPRAIDSPAQMFGYYQGTEWVDGLFTTILRKANRHTNKTWICLDSTIEPTWAERFISLLETPSSFFCDNGEQLFITDNVRIVFETTRLDHASPAITSKAAMTYYSASCLGWKSISHSWLQNNIKNLQDRKFLEDVFKKLFPPLVSLVLHELSTRIPVCEVGLVDNCLSFLTTLMKNSDVELEDYVNVTGGLIHVERLFLFSLIWTFGGLLTKEERKPMNDLIRNLSTALPDFDTDNSVFDYFVDESGEWDHWSSRVPELTQSGENLEPLKKLYVDTIPNLQARELIHFALLGGQHVMVYGPPRSGKTTLINNILDEHEITNPGECLTRKLVQSSFSAVRHLNDFFTESITHRQENKSLFLKGFVYGAPEGKRLQVFIDDVNLPCCNHYEPPANQLLRTLLDESILMKADKPYEWRTIEDLTIVTAMVTDPNIESTKMNRNARSNQSVPFISDRIIRQFLPVYLPSPTEKELVSIFNAVLQFEMQGSEGLSLDEEIQRAIVDASAFVVTEICSVLRSSSTPGRQHYVFSMNDILRSYKMLVFAKDEVRQSRELITSLWMHELKRTVQDQLCRQADLNWFHLLLKNTIEKYFAEYEITATCTDQLFSTLPIDVRHTDNVSPTTAASDGLSVMARQSIRCDLKPVENFDSTRQFLQSQLKAHNDEFGATKIDVKLSDFILQQIIACYRAFTLPSKGNMVVIGSVGTNMSILLKLVCRVANLTQFKIDFTSENSFMDGLRSIVRMTGSEGRTLAVCISARDLTHDMYLHTLNSLLISGDYTTMFSADEIDGLYQALAPQIRRDFPNELVDPEKYFIHNVMRNLHVFFTLPPTHSLINRASREFPGFLSCCEVYWVRDWSREVLQNQTKFFLGHSKLKFSSPQISEKVERCLVDIHSHVLSFCDQMKLVGQFSDKVTITSVRQHKKQGEVTYRTSSKEVDNLPYTKLILSEMMDSESRSKSEIGAHEVYHGAKSFHTFLNAFLLTYREKKGKLDARLTKLNRALSTLSDVRNDVTALESGIIELENEFERSTQESNELFNLLTDKSTTLELVKARCGITTGSLAAMLEFADQQNDTTLEEQDFELLRDDGGDTGLEFMQLREKNVAERVSQLDEAVLDLHHQLEEIRTEMQSRKDNVINWRKKVDKESGCLDRIKNFQSPPLLVAVVLEMLMNLVGKKKLQEFKIEVKNFDFTSSRRLANGKLRLRDLTDEGKVDRGTWKSMQSSLLSDVKKLTDLMTTGIDWEDGLSEEQVGVLRHYIGKWSNTEPGVTGEGSLIDGPKADENGDLLLPDFKYPKGVKIPSPSGEEVLEVTKIAQWNKRLESPVEEGLTIGAVRFSSEDAASLLAFMVALLEYTEQCGPLKETLKNIEARKREKEDILRLDQEMKELEEKEAEQLQRRQALLPPEMEEEKQLTKEDIPRLEREMLEVQKQYDGSIFEKYSLGCKLKESRTQLASLRELIQNLTEIEVSWASEVDKHSEVDQLLTNSVLVSAFLTYCGPLNTDHRNMVCRRLVEIASECGMPEPTNKLFASLIRPHANIRNSLVVSSGGGGRKRASRQSSVSSNPAAGHPTEGAAAGASGSRGAAVPPSEAPRDETTQSRAPSKAVSLSASQTNLDILHNQSTLTIGAALVQNEQMASAVAGVNKQPSRQESRAASSVFSLDESDMEMTPLSFLLNENELQREENKGVLLTRSTADNLAVALQEESSNDRWLLLSDPTGYAVEWVQTVIDDPENVVVVTHDEMKMELFHALMNGSTLLVTDVNPDVLLADESFRVVMQKRMFFLTSEESVKMKVANEEVEIDPGFRLFLHTSLEPQYIREELAAVTTVLRLDQSRDDTMEQMLDRFLTLEKPRLQEERRNLQKDKLSYGTKLNKLEGKLLKSLSKGSKVCGVVSKTKQLQLLKKQHSETKDNIRRAIKKLIDIITTRESYREVAVRGAVMFEATLAMARIDHRYMVSHRHLFALFEHCIQQADNAQQQQGATEASSIRMVNDKLTTTIYQCTIRSLEEKDRFIYSLILAFLIEESYGRVHVGDREYVIHPHYGQATMQAMRALFPSPENKPAAVSGKKPFDWMKDEACSQLVILATHFPWFTDAYERMPRDGRETQWRTLCENELPEKAALPDKLDDTFTPIQRLMVVRGVRGDRVLQAAEHFIQQVLSKRVTDCGISVDYTQIHKHTNNRTPIALFYTREPEVSRYYVEDAAKKLGVKITSLSVNLNTSEEAERIKEIIAQAMVDGEWVFLGTAHNNRELLASLNSFLDSSNGGSSSPTGGTGGIRVQSQFQLWLSLNWRNSAHTSRLFRRNAMKILCDPPKNLRDHMLSLPMYLTNDILRVGGRSDYPALLHNIAIIHGLVNLRAQYGVSGWASDALMSCTVRQLERGLWLASGMFREAMLLAADGGPSDLKSISWLGIRAMLAENVYGGHITNNQDREKLHAICEQWIGSLLLRKDHEHSLGKIASALLSTGLGSNFSTLAEHQNNRHNISDDLQSLTESELNYFVGPSLTWTNLTTGGGPLRPQIRNINSYLDFIIKYKIPSPFFSSNPKMGAISLSLQNFLHGVTMDAPDLANMNATLDMYRGEEQYILSNLNKIMDSTTENRSLIHVLEQTPSPCEQSGSLLAVNFPCNQPHILDMGVFASGSRNLMRQRRQQELFEMVHSVLQKLPRPPGEETIQDLVKRRGGYTPFNCFLLKEMNSLFRIVDTVKEHLKMVRQLYEPWFYFLHPEDEDGQKDPKSRLSIPQNTPRVVSRATTDNTNTNDSNNNHTTTNGGSDNRPNQSNAVGTPSLSNRNTERLNQGNSGKYSLPRGGTKNLIKHAIEDPTKVLGDTLNDVIKSVAMDLHMGRIPREWLGLASSWERGPKEGQWTLIQWVNDLTARATQLERMLQQGREKCPAYWLGGFYNPRGLLACLKQELLKSYSDAAGQVEQLVFRTEITGRDKDHLRDPPPEGMFMHSLFMWGCRWEKSNMELVDEPASPRGFCPLPVVHLVPTPKADKPIPEDIFRCPVYISQNEQNQEPLFHINIKKEKVPASRWALRGLRCTTKPY
ncbi:dynein axonemal heavy chain 5-like isoform X4 [Convolutriloba macropyga]|uniref:dynein axonemal heavy chain 5-like isoform X4 n=1 Tax=Convolutriloba macropyga TaxID=536237 RepID=UPI003F51F341